MREKYSCKVINVVVVVVLEPSSFLERIFEKRRKMDLLWGKEEYHERAFLVKEKKILTEFRGQVRFRENNNFIWSEENYNQDYKNH